MVEPRDSPWARPGPDDLSPAVVSYPPQPRPSDPPSNGGAASGDRNRTGDRSGGHAGRGDRAHSGWSRAGAVTQIGAAGLPGDTGRAGASGTGARAAFPGVAHPDTSTPDVIEFGPPRSPEQQRRRTLLIFGGVAGGAVLIGIVVLLVLAMTGNSPIHGRDASGPPDVLPPLAKACPPPTADPQRYPAAPAPTGARTVDTDAGISYARQGAPWTPWDEVWDAGDLHVKYGVGQHFVTETYTGGEYHASILSGSVPAAENDALSLDLKCTGHQVLADVRSSYYPQPNTIDMMRDEVGSLGGRPAWITKFRLHFHEPGLRADSELVGLALIDVGRPNAAIIYVSIPNTVDQCDPLVDQVLASVRPT